LYACGFRIYFTPLPGFFSPFPHGTGSLSVDYEYLALEDGPPIFRQDFSCPALLLATLVPRSRFRIRGYHPLWPAFPDRFANSNANGCRLLRFRSPLLSESRLISVPPATEMFQFTGFALPTLWIQVGVTLSKWFSTICPQTIFARLLLQMAFNESHLLRAGFPHSDICGSMLVCQLPAAFRRLPRPSSPVIAKASTTCTLVLDPITLRPRSRPQGGSAKGLLQRLCCSHCHRTQWQ
jgi:hypothetical protein